MKTIEAQLHALNWTVCDITDVTENQLKENERCYSLSHPLPVGDELALIIKVPFLKDEYLLGADFVMAIKQEIDTIGNVDEYAKTLLAAKRKARGRTGCSAVQEAKAAEYIANFLGELKVAICQ